MLRYVAKCGINGYGFGSVDFSVAVVVVLGGPEALRGFHSVHVEVGVEVADGVGHGHFP